MYVDGFQDICGDSARESAVLQDAQAFGIDALTLYDFPKLQARSGALSDTTSRSNRCLAEFVRRSRRSGIREIGAAFESVEALHGLLAAYQHSRPDSASRLDAFVLEFEWWSPTLVGPGGIYCKDYFLPLGVACNESAAWSWASRLMVALDSVATRSGTRRVVYASRFDLEQARWIVSHSDRVLLSNYIDDPEDGKAYDHAKSRMSVLAQAGGVGELVILWSAEGTGDAVYLPYLGDWLFGRPPWTRQHGLGEAEDLFEDQWLSADPTSPLRARLVGHQWFSWSHISRNAPLSVTRRIVLPGIERFHDPLGRRSSRGCINNGPLQILRCR
jgi:hypothetical protein